MAKPARAAPLPPAWRGPAVLAWGASAVLLAWGSREARAHELLRKLLEVGPFGVVPAFGAVTGRAWLGHGLMLLRLVWLTAAWTGTGAALLRAAGLRPSSRVEALVLAFALGSGAWAPGFLLLGLVGLLKAPLPLFLLGVGGAGGAWSLARGLGAEAAPPLAPGDKKEAGLFILLLACNLVMLGVYAAMPETFFDALEYHLAVPDLFLRMGRIAATPDNAFSGIPSTAWMLYGWALALEPGGVAAHLLNLSALAWSAAALAGLGRRLGSAAAGLAGAAVFASCPIVSGTAFLTSIEQWWAFYLLACLSALLAALELAPGDPARRRWILAAGFLLGCGMATKYLAWAAPAGLLALCLRPRGEDDPRRLTWTEAAWAGAVAGAVLTPWLLKNLLLYANPVYPFFHDTLAPSAEVMPAWRYLGSGTTFSPAESGWLVYAKDCLLSPLRMVYYRGNHGESLGPAFVALLPFALLARFEGPARAARRFALGIWLPFAFLIRLPRYFIPAAALFALLGCVGLWKGLEARPRRLALAVLFASMSLTLFHFWGWVLPRERWAVFAGTVSAEAFLGKGDSNLYPSPLYPVVDFLARETPPDARILVFGDSRGFYIPRDRVVSTPGQATVLERLANASASPREIRERLGRMGVGWIVVNYAEMFREHATLRFSPEGKKNLDDFWARYTLKAASSGPRLLPVEKNGKKYLDHWVAAYRLLDEDEAARTHPSDDLFQAFKVSGL